MQPAEEVGYVRIVCGLRLVLGLETRTWRLGAALDIASNLIFKNSSSIGSSLSLQRPEACHLAGKKAHAAGPGSRAERERESMGERERERE